jgi:hypothetical protein
MNPFPKGHGAVGPVWPARPMDRMFPTKSRPAVVQQAPWPNSVLRPAPPPVFRPGAPVLQNAGAFPKMGRPMMKAAGLSIQTKFPQTRPATGAPPVYRPIAQTKSVVSNGFAQRGAVQKYKKAKDGLWSDNDLYFLPGGGGDHLWALSTAAAPLASNATGGNTTIDKKKYNEYKSSFLLQDCLHTAEEIMAGGTLKYGAGVYSKTADAAGTAFGETAAKNRAIATARAALVTSNAAAAPGVGQAFVIARKKAPGADESPYHAAAVVAVDGTDRFTLEQSANGVDAHKRALAVGSYDVYSDNDAQGTSFHTRHAGTYANGVTFVLRNNGTARVDTFANRDTWRDTHKATAAGTF